MSKEIDNVKQKIVPVLKAHKVSRAGIFGSYAWGEQKKRSDVDILVEIPDDRSLLEVAGLKGDLEKALRKKVDLVEYELIRKELKKSILKDEISVALWKEIIKLYIDDIRSFILVIEKYTQEISEQDFKNNIEKQDVVIRRIEIIGEASRNILRSVKEANKGIPWFNFSQFRDLVAHSYFEISLNRVWRIAKEDIPKLKVLFKRVKLVWKIQYCYALGIGWILM